MTKFSVNDHILTLSYPLGRKSQEEALTVNLGVKRKNSIITDVTCYKYVFVLIFCCCIVCMTGDKPIDSVASLTEYKGCTEIRGNLNIMIRGSGGSGLLTKVQIFPFF